MKVHNSLLKANKLRRQATMESPVSSEDNKPSYLISFGILDWKHIKQNFFKYHCQKLLYAGKKDFTVISASDTDTGGMSYHCTFNSYSPIISSGIYTNKTYG